MVVIRFAVFAGVSALGLTYMPELHPALVLAASAIGAFGGEA